MTQRLRALELLGEELERAATMPSHETLARARAPRLPPGRVGALILVLLALAVSAAAAAAVLLIKEGSPLPAPHAQDLRSEGIPLPGSARLAGLDAPDPSRGEAPWDLRLSRTSTGETCTAVGQVVGGRLGIVGLDRVFRALPVSAEDSCGYLDGDAPALVGAQTFVGRDAEEARTVVSGVAGSHVRAVFVYAHGARRRLRIGPAGGFITVYGGEAEAVQPRVVVVQGDGRARTIALEQSEAFSVTDPEGGAAWAVSANADMQSGASPDESCVQVTRENSQSEPSHEQLPLTPEICGHLSGSPLFVEMRRFVPGEEKGPYPWGDSPARTVLYGVAAPRVKSLELTIGAEAVQPVAVDRHGGGFAVVLDGHVDPRMLVLTARLRDGQSIRFKQPTGILSAATNEPIPTEPPPAYRTPRPIRATLPPPFEVPIASTQRETLHASDPQGGPEWVLRSWQGSPNPQLKWLGSERMTCAELLVRWNGKLVQPTATPSSSTPGFGVEEGRCNTPRELVEHRYMLLMQAFLTDPYAYAPRPGRVVISGLLPPGARDPVLVGAGADKAISPDANGAFLVVLPGRWWHVYMRVSYVSAGKRVGRLHGPDSAGFSNGPPRPQVRAPDPDGAAPWGFTASFDCSTAIGRVVEGWMASIDPDGGVLQSGATITGSSSTCISRGLSRLPKSVRKEPVEFDVQPVDRVDPLTPASDDVGRAEVEHRTLPGRTIVTGVAKPDVESVTISTPSDVRTLRPLGPSHAILSVYAGFFVRGRLSATVRLRDGKTETEQIASFLTGELSSRSLASQLRSAREQLVLLRGSEQDDPRRRRSDRSVVQAIDEHIAQLRRRIGYEREHPGLLPAE